MVFTAGHSTLSIEEFLELLELFEIRSLADVRRYPASRRHPQFNQEPLQAALRSKRIDYRHLLGLGGRRAALPESPNTGWEAEGFRGYADYMGTGGFLRALGELEELARADPTVVVCAEALWWRCHRRLIADALVVRGWHVVHVRPESHPQWHRLTSFAVTDGNAISYPAEQGVLGV